MSSAAIISHLVQRQIDQASRLRDIALFDHTTIRLLIDGDCDDDSGQNPIVSAWDPHVVSNNLGRWDSYGAENGGAILAIDFSEVHTVTASWWEQVWLRVLEESTHWRIYPIASNVPRSALYELELVARMHRTCIAVCEADHGDKLWRRAQLIGCLEQGERDAMRVLLQQSALDAAAVHTELNKPGLVTGVNNRLERLHKRRLAYKLKRGRGYVYFPVLPFSLELDAASKGQRFYATEPSDEMEASS